MPSEQKFRYLYGILYMHTYIYIYVKCCMNDWKKNGKRTITVKREYGSVRDEDRVLFFFVSLIGTSMHSILYFVCMYHVEMCIYSHIFVWLCLILNASRRHRHKYTTTKQRDIHRMGKVVFIFSFIYAMNLLVKTCLRQNEQSGLYGRLGT